MKTRVLLMLAILFLMFVSPTGLADWSIAKNVTQRSTIYLSGYMDEMSIYQTEKGLAGQKLVFGTRGSGTVSRTQTTYVDECGIYFNVQGEFDYKPYKPKTSESDLRSALCAKNYEVGTVISESYTGIVYLIEDTTVSQNDDVPVYQISSQERGVARLGAW
ncbi:MAG TPA: hypothetical protein HA349_02715 [Methanotrichaceae archaeon]|nr:hypothetical protein [Methanotrichaceae archaeon]